jgi:hypothetical protein
MRPRAFAALRFMTNRMTASGTLRHPPMSALRSLAGVDRTWRGQPISVENDPGCVKTCTSQECAELFSLSSSLSSGRKHFWFSNLRNRDGISTRRLNVGVFTRPRPISDIWPDPSLRPTSAIAQRLVRAPYYVIDTPFLLTAGAIASIEACDASVVSS